MAGGIANLKPFVKGKSGNPGGRKKTPPDVKSLARDHGMDAMKALIGLLKSSDERVKLQAATVVLDRGFGRVAQVADDAAASGVTIQIVQMPATNVSRETKTIEHNGANGYHAAEQVAPPTVSIRPVVPPTGWGQEGGGGLSS